MNLIFDLLVLLRFFTAPDGVSYCAVDEAHSRLNKVEQQTWRIIALLLGCEVVDMDAPRTALCYVTDHYRGCGERTIESALWIYPQFDEQTQNGGFRVPYLPRS